MIKGELKMNDAAVRLQPAADLRKKVETILSEEIKIKNLIIDETKTSELNIKARFNRLRKRVRCRSSNIL